MNKIINGRAVLFVLLLVITIVFSYAVANVDIQPIGPENSEVGFATFNSTCAEYLPYNEIFYIITQISGYVSITIALAVGLCAVAQWVQRKNMFKIDIELLLYSVLVCFTFCIYVFFEIKHLNYRPVLVDGELDPSFPSSHMLVVCTLLGMLMCLMPQYIKPGLKLYVLEIVLMVIIEGTVLGRILSGVHWATDIAAGLLISATIISLDRWLVRWVNFDRFFAYKPLH